MYNLLTLCTRTHCDAAYYHQLRQKASEFTQWESITHQAEAHSLGPLLYTHLRAAGVQLQPSTKRELQGLYLRHRHANEVRVQVLAEILTAFHQAEIQALVLKGAALAQIVYPKPALRPMRDLDILVEKSQVRRAQSILAELGFHAPLPTEQLLPSKHLKAATRTTEGLLVSVEIHHNLFHDNFNTSMTFDELTTPPLSFYLNGSTIYTLGYEDMLWHLCQHIVNIAQPFRLIWLADIVGFAERYVTEIDWRRIEQHYPLVLNTLSLFHFATPLSDTLRQIAPLKIGSNPPGFGQEFQGWPRLSVGRQRATGKGYQRIIRDTFFPSEWWLRLYYGLGSTRPIFWQRWIGHPFRILRWMGKLLTERFMRDTNVFTLQAPTKNGLSSGKN